METEAEKYLAQLFSWFIYGTYLLTRIFLQRHLMIFQVFALQEHIDHFENTGKAPSHKIAKELLTVICRTPLYLQQWRTNAKHWKFWDSHVKGWCFIIFGLGYKNN